MREPHVFPVRGTHHRRAGFRALVLAERLDYRVRADLVALSRRENAEKPGVGSHVVVVDAPGAKITITAPARGC